MTLVQKILLGLRVPFTYILKIKFMNKWLIFRVWWIHSLFIHVWQEFANGLHGFGSWCKTYWSSFIPLVLTKQWALNGWKEKSWDSNTRCMFNADTHGRVMVLPLLFGGWGASRGQFRPQQKVTKWSFRQHCRQRPHEEWPGNWEKGLAPELMSKQNAIRRLVWYS